jgi:hypothetical protein
MGPGMATSLTLAKSWYICKVEDKAIAQQAFKANELDIQYSRGQRYLGGFNGSNASKMDWLSSMVTTWVAAVEMLALLSGNYPQAAYTRFTFCLQNKWQYVQPMTSDTAPHFALLEVAIRMKFLLALLGIAASGWQVPQAPDPQCHNRQHRHPKPRGHCRACP